MRILELICVLSLWCATVITATDTELDTEATTFQIEGKVTPPDPKPKDWHWTTKIYLDGGKRMAYLKVRLDIFPFGQYNFTIFFSGG